MVGARRVVGRRARGGRERVGEFASRGLPRRGLRDGRVALLPVASVRPHPTRLRAGGTSGASGVVQVAVDRRGPDGHPDVDSVCLR